MSPHAVPLSWEQRGALGEPPTARPRTATTSAGRTGPRPREPPARRVPAGRPPGPGLARPYRSGSGWPPRYCGPQTRTKALPSSRQGLRRVSLTPRATRISSPRPGGGHNSSGGGVERPEQRRGGGWVTPPHPLPYCARGPQGLAGKKGGSREKEEMKPEFDGNKGIKKGRAQYFCPIIDRMRTAAEGRTVVGILDGWRKYAQTRLRMRVCTF